MDETTRDPLTDQFRSLLLGEGGGAGEIVFYTSFGVVRGRVAPAFLKQLAERHPESPPAAPPMVEIYDATVEHYSSHLPTGSFTSFYVRLADINGLAVKPPQPQG